MAVLAKQFASQRGKIFPLIVESNPQCGCHKCVSQNKAGPVETRGVTCRPFAAPELALQ